MRGPLNPSTNYTCGMLVSGVLNISACPDDALDPPWYPRLLETYPLFKEQDLFAYLIERENSRRPSGWRKIKGKAAEEKPLFIPHGIQSHNGRETFAPHAGNLSCFMGE